MITNPPSLYDFLPEPPANTIQTPPDSFSLWSNLRGSTSPSPSKRPLTGRTAMPLNSKHQRVLSLSGNNRSTTGLDPETGIMTTSAAERIWCYGSQEYTMLRQTLGSGQFCQVRGFPEGQDITLQLLEGDTRVEKTYPSQDLAVKVISPLLKQDMRPGNRGRKEMTFNAFPNIEKGYEYLASLPEQDRIPVARMIATPNTLINPKTGMTDLKVYIVERKAAPATSKMTQWAKATSVDDLPNDERSFLDWVKRYVTKIAIHGLANSKELYNDFAPKNVMFDSEGNAKVVDYSLPQKDWARALRKHVNAWARGNRVIFDYLVDVGNCGREGWNLRKHLEELVQSDPFDSPGGFNPFIPTLISQGVVAASSSSSPPELRLNP